jgi:hypothetical protein
VRSNAIVIASDPRFDRHRRGADEPRSTRCRLAVEKAAPRPAWSCRGSALASDAFFPFADGPQLALDAGVTAIIQPGGSKRDHEVVEAADEAGISDGLSRTGGTSGTDADSRGDGGGVEERTAGAFDPSLARSGAGRTRSREQCEFLGRRAYGL